MESLRRLTSSIFDSDSRLSLTRRGSIGSQPTILSPTSEAAAVAAQRVAPNGLDLTFITDRLVVMGYPVQGPTDKKRNQNNIDDLAEYLETHHSNQYLIFNLNTLEDDVHVQDLQAFLSPKDDAEASEAVRSIADKVRHQMLEFTWERDGMKAHTPPFDLIFRLCYAIFAWLSLDASNVALINCQTGKTRSGIVVACYLLYARLADDPTDAFVEFYRKRWDMKSLTPEALRLKTPPSILRFLSCFHDVIENQRVPNIKPLLLKGIIIRSVPVEFQPCIQIWDDNRMIYCTDQGHSSGNDGLTTTGLAPVLDWDSEEGCLAILWEDGLNLDGGFSILCSFGDEYDEDETTNNVDASSKVLFRYADSTWFLAPGLIALTKSKLDMMKQYEEAFKEEYFSMDLVFAESKVARRKYVAIDCTGNAAVRQGVVEITKHHLVLPDPAMHSNFMKMGFSDAATTFALQRSQNAPNIALDLLHSSVLSTCFVQSAKAVQEARTRPALQSFSSTSRLPADTSAGQAQSTTTTPIARRQSTAEIAALQSQRSRYAPPSASTTSAVCSLCKDDDYMMRPQIVRCTGPCGNFSHTTCVGLKKIPFGLTTLSDRTNHAVYVKKYFSAWECDACAAARAPPVVLEPVHSLASAKETGCYPSALSRTQPHPSSRPSQGIQQPLLSQSSPQAAAGASMSSVKQGDEEKMDKLKEFLAMSGVSVDDLLRAATTANVTISPSAGAIELPKVAAPTQTAARTLEDSTQNVASPINAVQGSPNGALAKLFTSGEPRGHENPQDSAPKKISRDEASQAQLVTDALTSQVPTNSEKILSAATEGGRAGLMAQIAARKSKEEGKSATPEVGGRSGLLAQIAARKVSASVDTTPPKPPVEQPRIAPASNPTAALFAQIAARRNGSDEVNTVKAGAQLEDQPTTNVVEVKQEDSKPTKYEMMLQRGVPFEAVQNCMKKDGVDPSTLKAVVTTSNDLPLTEAKTEASGTKLKETAEFRGYFNMLRLGCPKEAVKQKILMDGADPVVLELGPDAIFEDVKAQIKVLPASQKSTLQDDIKSVKSYQPVAKPVEKVTKVADEPAASVVDKTTEVQEVLLKDHETYSKYFKMLKMGLPEDAVRHKMKQDGVNERALELGGDAPISKLDVKSAEVRLADDPAYSKYFKMLKMGLPQDAVRHKMVMDEVNPKALELGPNAFVSQLQGAPGAAKTSSPAIKPKSRRKKLHWQPISDDRLSSINRQTIWEDKDDEVELDMDMAELESLFFASSDNKKKKASTNQPKTLKRKQSVTLIDGKRAMNAAISLARVKLSHAEIAHAVSTFDATGLTMEQLRGIRDSLPTVEEVQLVSKYNGDFAMLGDAEKFIAEISKVRRYTMRTECLLFRMSFTPREQELKKSLDNLIDACQQVKESRLLKTLLSVVLKLGNTLNGSGDDNEIRGFTVDSLLRLGHTKAVNQKTTVLHFLVRLVKKNHPAVLDFQGELKSVPLAAREAFESVDEDFGKLQSGLTQLSEEFQDLQKDEQDEQVQATVTSLQAAVEEIGGQMESLDRNIKRARDEVQSVLEYFGEDPMKNPSEFFSTLSSFCSMFDAARKEVDAADEAAQRAERVKMRRNASMRPSSSASGAASASVLRGAAKDKDRAASDRGLVATRSILEEDA